MRVICGDNHQTVKFAVEELARYLGRITGRDIAVGSNDSAGNCIKVEVDSKLTGINDPKFDDAILIDIQNESGRITGSNPRSALIGVYRYLTELGCRWVRPTIDGEFIPKLDSLPDVNVQETASYRHRGICIEGSVSEEQIRDLLDWMPKVGFNAYFIQFREAYTFFERWYGMGDNQEAPSKDFTVEDARLHTANVVEEIKKRDILYHAIGHGWTCEPLGFSSLGWYANKDELSEEISQYLAEVNGKRELWGGTAINTNLCYGNPKARKLIVDEIANYLDGHSEIDVLHFWLADGSNNNCECELCRDTRPSDFYVTMLNELDEELTARDIDTRIVALIYVDLMWPPLKEKINNQGRFILMFAPITRSYTESFKTDLPLGDLPPYERNKLQFPSSVEGNLAFLKAWQNHLKGDSFDFDYHMWGAHYADPAHMSISDILSQDIKALKDIGLNGIVSCQVQRAFFPTGLPMTTMGRMLWNRELNYEKFVSEYFNNAYGPDGALVEQYLEKLSELLHIKFLLANEEKSGMTPSQRLAKAANIISDFASVISKNLKSENTCWAKSWSYLADHAEILKLLIPAFDTLLNDDKEKAQALWAKTREYIWENRNNFNNALDVCSFVTNIRGYFR